VPRGTDRRLQESPYLAGADYTIADIALWGWANAAPYIFGEAGLAPFLHVARLVAEISARPAALRAR
jgi:GST-like protein